MRQARVYLANGQVFVYSPEGREIGVIEVPERPLQLLINGNTLFILTHHTLYAARAFVHRARQLARGAGG